LNGTASEGLKNVVRMETVFNSSWYEDNTDLKSEFYSSDGLNIKPLALIDSTLSQACYRATCFIIFRKGTDFATGFLIKWKKKRFILTNAHVLGLIEDAKSAVLEFRALDPILRIKLEPERVHLVSGKWNMDFALIAISEKSLRELDEFSVAPLEIKTDNYFDALEVQIIGYPAGLSILRKSQGHLVAENYDANYEVKVPSKEMEILLKEPKLELRKEEIATKLFAYRVLTAGGSSGSPILTADGFVIGIHHKQIDGGVRIGTRMSALVPELEKLYLEWTKSGHNLDHYDDYVKQDKLLDDTDAFKLLQAKLPNYEDRRRDGDSGYFPGTRLDIINAVGVWLSRGVQSVEAKSDESGATAVSSPAISSVDNKCTLKCCNRDPSLEVPSLEFKKEKTGLYIKAVGGVGKSVMSTQFHTQFYHDVVAYHYCVYNSGPEFRDPRTIIRSIMFQLYSRVEWYRAWFFEKKTLTDGKERLPRLDD